jgi:hypothetical protein
VAWGDFNVPSGVAGFGPLTTEDARRLLAQAIGESEAVDPAPDGEINVAVHHESGAIAGGNRNDMLFGDVHPVRTEMHSDQPALSR